MVFSKACREAGIQPILGMTATAALSEDLAVSVDGVAAPGPLVLLATGPHGYQSLCQLSSLMQASAERESLAARGFSLDDL